MMRYEAFHQSADSGTSVWSPKTWGEAIGQVGVPVVERDHGATEQARVPGAGRVGSHRHGGDRREAGDPVRSPGLDRVHLSRGDELNRLVPAGPDEAPLATRRLVARPALRVAHQLGPGEDRVPEASACLAVHLEQHAAHIGEADPSGRVRVPREGRTPRAPTRLVLGRVRADRRVVGLLGLPGDDAVFHVHLPRARPGAVDAVGGPDDAVVRPAVAVEDVAISSAVVGDGSQVGVDPVRLKEAAGPAAMSRRGRRPFGRAWGSS